MRKSLVTRSFLKRVLVVFASTTIFARWVAGCAAPATPRRPVEMEPIGTVPNVPRTAKDTSDASVTTPNSGTPSPLYEGPCSGGNFEQLDEALRQCESKMPATSEIPSALGSKLEVQATTSTSRVKAGGHLEIVVVLRNRSADPLPLYFTGDPTPRFDIETLDSKGKRVDLPPGKPPKASAGPTETKAAKVTLSPAGSAHLKLSWDAVKTKWAPEKKTWEGRGFPRAPAGPLPAGKYTLRVVIPMLGDLELPKLAVAVD